MTPSPSNKFNGNATIQNGNFNGNDSEFVISGMSGIFPSSANIEEFRLNLFNKVNMVNDDESRWKHVNPRIPKRNGKIPSLEHFDATFFGIHQLQADKMDPQNRLLIEEAFKAVMDAGVNPFSLRGSRTGVYVGACMSESEVVLFTDDSPVSGFNITGCSKSMFANRISFVLGLNGPSLNCDTACSSSMYALDLAYRALVSGEIDAAIVGGANICLHPNITHQFFLLGVISPTGHCRPFDESANGYTRSEAIGCIFIQRRSVAKRIYASLVYSQTNCDGYKPEGVTYPSGAMQERLLRDVYAKTNIDLNEIGYFEAHSTGTVVGDPEECRAIDNAICSGRTEPLLVGSVKSNCGHAEPASGICSIAKVLFTMQNSIIPPNIGFETKRKDLKALIEGRLKVVDNPTKLTKPYIGINSFGFGGANAHAVLKQNEKTKRDLENIKSPLPRLVTYAARTENNIKAFFDDLITRPLDEEYLALVHSVHEGGIQGMIFRGYCLLQDNQKENCNILSQRIQHSGGVRPPIAWVFSGMGSQWAGMGKTLMEIPLFNNSIQKCHKILKPSGLDLIKIITTDDPNVFDNIMHSFVGIAAIQIALVDILRAIGITPDFIIGHSVGELGCAYADGCFTAEQMILAAYYRGKVSFETEKIKGSMAAVGLSYAEIINMLPETIQVACHNSKESCTISGPSEEISKFVAKLKLSNIFAREVPCSNIAYHSKYISHFGPKLLKYLKHIIPEPKQRSKKWISTSVPKTQWLQDECKYSSAEYHTNNLLSSVLFEEGTSFLPNNILTIEISPHSLLNSILKGARPNGLHISLTKRGTTDGVQHLLSAIGSLYVNNLEILVDRLYPAIEFPVSNGTRTLSSNIFFDHKKDHLVYSVNQNHNESGIGNKTFNIKIDDLHSYLKGHTIDSRVLVPATFYLECVWRTFASMNGILVFDALSVEFENVRFERATTLTPKSTTILHVVIHKSTGYFEISESGSLVASGIVRDLNKNQPNDMKNDVYDEYETLNKKDFYKDLKLRGYHYTGDFQNVNLAYVNDCLGIIKWTNNWVAFIDCMLQLSIIQHDSRSVMLPTKLQNLRIYAQHHKQVIENKSEIEVFSNRVQKRIVAAGIEIIGPEANIVQRKRPISEPVVEKYEFVPHFPSQSDLNMDLDDIGKCIIQIILENLQTTKLVIVELHDNDNSKDRLIPYLKNAVSDLPYVTGDYININNFTKDISNENTNVIDNDDIQQLYLDDNINNIISNIVIMKTAPSAGNTRFSKILRNLDPNGFVIMSEKSNLQVEKYHPPNGFHPICFFPNANKTLVLLKPHNNIDNINADVTYFKLPKNIENLEWIEKLKELCIEKTNIIIVSEAERYNGVLGLVLCLRKEPETKNIRCILIDHASGITFDPNSDLFQNQLKLGLAVNIYKNKTWGSYRHLNLKMPLNNVIPKRNEHVYGNIKQIGDLSSFKWYTGPLTIDQQKIKIVYSSLNFKDAMQASGRLPITEIGSSRLGQTCIFGFEFSGIRTADGKPVMGMTTNGTVASHIQNVPKFVWEVPENWSLEQAATVPVVYLTVYYAFFYTANICNGQTILIHAGSGGIGLAAIRIAQAYGLEVYTTVSNEEKKNFLLRTFPKLKANHVGNSRDTSFEEMIKIETNGKGVDFVLNSLSEDKLKASVRCLGRKGHFLEIGKFDMAKDNDLGLGAFLNELNFHAVLADRLLIADNEFVQTLKNHIESDIKKGIIKPLPTTVFPANEIEQSFRYLMSGKHIGKVLLQIRENPNDDVMLPITILPQTYFKPDHVYVIPGGLGGFGLELTDWMILRGARKIVLSSRHGIINGYQKLRISIWKKYGCTVTINTSDISNYDGCLNLLTDALKLGPIGGIFNLAVVLRDAIFNNQTSEMFEQSFAPKAFATKYLDELSRKLCPRLTHFVVFSSVSCGRGNAGQTNYGMANSIMERIIEDRVANGYPGKAIQWGAVGEVGLAAQLAEDDIDLEIGGTLQQRISSCLDTLDVLLNTPDIIVSSMVVAEKNSLSRGLSPLDTVLNILSIKDLKSIPITTTLSELGMDSLMGVEIKQAFERDFDISLNIADLRTLSLTKLMEISESAKKIQLQDETLHNNKIELVQKNDPVNNVQQFYGIIPVIPDETDILHHVNDKIDGNPIIILPGIVGTSEDIWKTLLQSCDFPAYVLQYQKIGEAKTIQQLRDLIVKHIFNLLENHSSKQFQIVAYSAGAMLAHYVVASLENASYHGSVIHIDGSPFLIKNIINSLETIYADVEFDKFILATMLNNVVPKLKIETIENAIRLKFTKEEWFKYIVDNVHKYHKNHADFILNNIESIYQRLKIFQNPETYKTIDIVNAEYLLLKPANSTIITNLDATYGLSSFTKNIVKTKIIDGDHRSILLSNELPNIIINFFQGKL